MNVSRLLAMSLGVIGIATFGFYYSAFSGSVGESLDTIIGYTVLVVSISYLLCFTKRSFMG